MHFASASDTLAALHAREISAVELVEHAITRIQKLDVQLNAIVVRDFDRAREQAVQADKARSRGDERALLGLPNTVKESFDAAGMPTTWGIPVGGLAAADHDAVAVARLRNAGAIILGKSNVAAQLADWQSSNAVYILPDAALLPAAWRTGRARCSLDSHRNGQDVRARCINMRHTGGREVRAE